MAGGDLDNNYGMRSVRLQERSKSEWAADRNSEHATDSSRRDAIQRRNTLAARDPEISKSQSKLLDQVAGANGPGGIDTEMQKWQNMAEASKMMKAALILLGNGGCILSAAKLADAVEYLDVSITQQAAAGRMCR